MTLKAPLTNLLGDRRARARSSVDRRRSERWPTNRIVHWRHEADEVVRTGRLVSRSLDGFVVLIDTKDVASPLRRIVAVDQPDRPLSGFRTAIVRRHEVTCDGIVLYAEVES